MAEEHYLQRTPAFIQGAAGEDFVSDIKDENSK